MISFPSVICNLFQKHQFAASAVFLFVPSVVSCHEAVALFVPSVVSCHEVVVLFVPSVASCHEAVALFVPSVASCHEAVVLFVPSVASCHAAVVLFVPSVASCHEAVASSVASWHNVVVPLYTILSDKNKSTNDIILITFNCLKDVLYIVFIIIVSFFRHHLLTWLHNLQTNY